MLRKSQQKSTADIMAISLSSLYLLHCMAVPLVAALLPVFAVLEETEWLHRLLVMASAPISGWAIFQMRKHFLDLVFISTAVIGVSLLLISAFLERFHPQEKILTILGATFLIFGHLWRWRRHNHDTH